MNCFIYEISNDKKTSMSKARIDANRILQSIGYIPVVLNTTNHAGMKRIIRQFQILKEWEKTLFQLERGSSLIIQFPPSENSIFLGRQLKKISNSGVSIIILVHDIISKYNVSKIKKILYLFEEKRVFSIAEKIIIHNKRMQEIFEEAGIDKNKLVNLEIFDYIIPRDKMINSITEIKKELPTIIAGNLSPWKAAYLSSLPGNCEFNLYGIGFENHGKTNIHYQGSFLPDDLPNVMRGSFGLVWDGDSSETCSGKTGEYLRFNNPHKTSLYLACGIPVIIWSEAAMAEFILENHCGITVNSLKEIPEKIKNMTNREYATLKQNAKEIGMRLRDGHYLKKAIYNISLRSGLS